MTLLIAGAFGLAAGGANSFVTLSALLAVMGIGVGGGILACSLIRRFSELLFLSGNLPIDSAVFLGESASFGLFVVPTANRNCMVDFAPASHQYLLTFMSIFWCLGQLLVNLVSLPLFRTL